MIFVFVAYGRKNFRSPGGSGPLGSCGRNRALAPGHRRLGAVPDGDASARGLWGYSAGLASA